MIRSFFFNIYFFLWTTCVSSCILVTWILPRSFNFKLARLWAKGVMGGLRIIAQVHWTFKGHLPTQPSLLACQHQSVWETVVFHLLCHEPVFILKKELMHVPLFGWFLSALGMIGVHRKSFRGQHRTRLFQSVQSALRQGHHVIIFPQGQRSAPHIPLPCHSGVYHLAKQLSCAVVPLTLNAGCFWGRRQWKKQPGTIVLQAHTPVHCPDRRLLDYLNQLYTPSIE